MYQKWMERGTQHYSHTQPRTVADNVWKREMTSWPAPGGGQTYQTYSLTDESGLGYERKNLTRVTQRSGRRDQGAEELDRT